MTKKRIINLAIITAVLSILLTTLGVTFSFFDYIKRGSTENSITTGKITFLYTETSLGRGIELIDAVPLSDALGIAQTGEGKVFDFKITADTMKNTSIPYTVTVRKETVENELAEKDVKLYITEVNSNIEENGIVGKFNDGSIFPKYKDSDIERVIYTGIVTSNTSNYIQNLRLKMWIDKDADFSPLKDNDGNYIIENGEYKYPNNNKTFKVKVNVYANGNILTDMQVQDESKAEIVNLKIGTNTVVTSYSDNKLYEKTLPLNTTSTTLDIETSSPNQKVKIEKTNNNYISESVVNVNNLPLVNGDNYFKITVTSEDKKATEQYKVNIKVGDYERLLTTAMFDKYQSKESTIVLDNDINSPTFAFNDTSANKNQNGLYKASYTDNGNSKTSYYFRGLADNYLEFADEVWRIVRINEDGTIRIVLDYGIKDDESFMINSVSTNYSYNYYSNWPKTEAGYVKFELEDWYKNKINDVPAYNNRISTGSDYFCEQAKVVYKNLYSSSQNSQGSVVLSYANTKDYSPTYKCVEDANGYGYVKDNPKVGLLTFDEITYAGVVYEPSNINNYLSYRLEGTSYADHWWTMSPAGYSRTGYGYALVWATSTIYSFLSNKALSAKNTVRPVINLKADTMVKGLGTYSDHWVVVN